MSVASTRNLSPYVLILPSTSNVFTGAVVLIPNLPLVTSAYKNDTDWIVVAPVVLTR